MQRLENEPRWALGASPAASGTVCFGVGTQGDDLAFAGFKDRLIRQSEGRIRRIAIKNADQRIALNGVDRATLAEEDYEAIVAEERGKLIKKLQLGSLAAIAVILGIH